MTRGNIVNEFDEVVGRYNINGVNDYYVEMYKQSRGYMTEKQLTEYVNSLGLYIEEM